MRITDIVIEVYSDTPHPTPEDIPRFRSEDGWFGALVRVKTDEGIEGNHTFSTAATVGKGFSHNAIYLQSSEILGLLKPELVGRDAYDRAWLWDQFYAYRWWGHVSARPNAIVDMALWDLAGKAAGLPVYRLIGAAKHRIPAYCSGPHFADVKDYADFATQAKRIGYRGFKIKPGECSVGKVEEITTAVRAQVGEEMALMLDGELSYNYEQALEIGHHIQDLGFEWFENPVRHDDIGAYSELCGRLSLPIGYSDNPEVHFMQFADLFRRCSTIRMVRADPNRGGITGLKKICTLAEGFGARCEIHNSSLASLHVALTAGNCSYFEDTIHDVYNDHEKTLRQRPADHHLRIDKDGCVGAPELPGLGNAIDFERIEQNRVEILT